MDDNHLSYAAKLRVRNKLPQKRDVVDWGNTKILQFLKFVDFFTDNGKFVCTVPKVDEARMRAAEEMFWDEFLERINVTPGKDGGTTQQFRLRLTTFARNPLAWIKSNPHAITLEMMEIMEKNPRLAWAASSFVVVDTESGAQIVQLNNTETTDQSISNKDPKLTDIKTPMVQYEQARMNMLTMLVALSKSIPASELKNMPVKDRLAAFDRLFNTAVRVMGQSRPNSVIFNQLNVNKAGREDLEKSFLEYAEGQQP